MASGAFHFIGTNSPIGLTTRRAYRLEVTGNSVKIYDPGRAAYLGTISYNSVEAFLRNWQ